MSSLQDLLVPRDRESLRGILKSTLQGEGFPTSDWADGSVPDNLLEMIATGLLDRETLIGYIAAGGYLDLAAALTDANGTPIEGWLQMLAEQFYGLALDEPSFARQRLTLTCTSGPGPYTRAAGQMIAVSQAGNQYRNLEEVTIPDGGSVQATFQAEVAGPILDQPGTIDTLMKPFPGVTVANLATQFSDPVSRWNGTGTITPTMSTSAPLTARTFRVDIVASDTDGGALATLTTYTLPVAGQAYVAGATVGPFPTTAFVDGEVTLTFSSGTYVAGDHWFCSTPGSPLVASGCDAEALAALAQRCRDRWPALSAIPTEGKYAGWVRQCAIENRFGALRIASAPSTKVAGRVDIFAADSSGYLSPEQAQTIQDFVSDRVRFELETISIQPCETVAINLAGTALVKRGRLLVVKAAFSSAWAAYLASVPIGGDKPGKRPGFGVLRAGRLWQILMQAGAFDATGLQMNGAADDVDLGVHQVPVVGTDSITWREVA